LQKDDVNTNNQNVENAYHTRYESTRINSNKTINTSPYK